MPKQILTSRRRFLGAIAAVAGAGVMPDARGALGAAGKRGDLHISCQQVPWLLYSRRDGRKFDIEAAVAGAAEAGLDGFEPVVESPDELAKLSDLLTRHGLAMRSLY